MEDVRDTIRAVLRNGIDITMLADFVASVDWGGMDAAEPAVRVAIGNLSGWTTELTEGVISKPEFERRLQSLLPSAEQRRVS